MLVLVIGTARQQEGVIRHDLGTLKDAVDALRALAAVNQKYAVAGGHLDVGTVDVLLDLIGSGGDADGLAEFQCALACGAEVCTHAADIGVGHAGQLTVVFFNKGRGLCLYGGVDVGGFQQLLLDSLALGSGFDAQTDSSLHGKQHKEKCQRGDTAGDISDRFAPDTVVGDNIAHLAQIAVDIAGQADAAAALRLNDLDGVQRVQAVAALADDNDHIRLAEIILAGYKMKRGDDLDLALQVAADKLPRAERTVGGRTARNDPDVLVAAAYILIHKGLCQRGAVGDIVADKLRAVGNVVQHSLFVFHKAVSFTFCLNF